MNTWMEARVQRARLDDLRREADCWRMVHAADRAARPAAELGLDLARLRRWAGWRRIVVRAAFGLGK